jgi:hypothetical protein
LEWEKACRQGLDKEQVTFWMYPWTFTQVRFVGKRIFVKSDTSSCVLIQGTSAEGVVGRATTKATGESKRVRAKGQLGKVGGLEQAGTYS